MSNVKQSADSNESDEKFPTYRVVIEVDGTNPNAPSVLSTPYVGLGEAAIQTFQVAVQLQLSKLYLSFVDRLHGAKVIFEIVVSDPEFFDSVGEFRFFVSRLESALSEPPALVIQLDLTNPKKSAKDKGAAQTVAEGVAIYDAIRASAYTKAAILEGIKRLNALDFAELSADEISFFQRSFEEAAKHRARMDLFGVKKGEMVTVQQVNRFLKENAGRILETNEKVQLAKVIQELVKSQGAELWKEVEGWEYRCTVSTKKRNDASTRMFVIRAVDPQTKIKANQTTRVPENLTLLDPEV